MPLLILERGEEKHLGVMSVVPKNLAMRGFLVLLHWLILGLFFVCPKDERKHFIAIPKIKFVERRSAVAVLP